MQTEPSVIVAGATSVATAVIAFIVAFGVPLSSEQQTATLGLVAVVAPLVAGLLIRTRVWSPDSHAAEVIAAARSGVATTK